MLRRQFMRQYCPDNRAMPSPRRLQASWSQWQTAWIAWWASGQQERLPGPAQTPSALGAAPMACCRCGALGHHSRWQASQIITSPSAAQAEDGTVHSCDLKQRTPYECHKKSVPLMRLLGDHKWCSCCSSKRQHGSLHIHRCPKALLISRPDNVERLPCRPSREITSP